METIIKRLKEQAKGREGALGEQRANELETYLRNKLKEYSEKLGVPEIDILKSWEEDRNYSAINYYQESKQPLITSKKVKIFETVEEMSDSVGKEFRCPACNAITTNPYECNSGANMSKNKVCDWKVYGLFGDLGKGAYVYCKDKLKGNAIFMPIAWETEE